MIFLKAGIIFLVILLYWKFVYYKYHKRDITPISFLSIGGLLFFYGLYTFFIKKTINFEDIKIVYFIVFLFLLGSFIFDIIGIKKKGLTKDVDIFLTWAKKVFPYLSHYFWMIIAFPALFFILIATRSLLGIEHLVFWGMIFLAWLVSCGRLIRHIKKK